IVTATTTERYEVFTASPARWPCRAMSAFATSCMDDTARHRAPRVDLARPSPPAGSEGVNGSVHRPSPARGRAVPGQRPVHGRDAPELPKPAQRRGPLKANTPLEPVTDWRWPFQQVLRFGRSAEP